MTTTVLLVDDDRDLLPLLTTALNELGDFRVFSADNGADGLRHAIEQRPHCIVIDVRMPQLDGYQMVRALRGDSETADIPLVMLTAMAQDKDRFIGMAAGADQYLLKPIKPLELIEAITQAIALGEESRQQRMQQLADEPPPAK